MEVSNNGWVVLVVMLTILGVGGGAIATATLRPLGQLTPFTTPITDLSTPISGAARQQFNQGIFAYREGAYAKAIDCFTKVLDREPTLAEAFHNRARAQANLAKKQEAVGDFVAASDLYDRQGSKSGIDWIKNRFRCTSKSLEHPRCPPATTAFLLALKSMGSTVGSRSLVFTARFWVFL